MSSPREEPVGDPPAEEPRGESSHGKRRRDDDDADAEEDGEGVGAGAEKEGVLSPDGDGGSGSRATNARTVQFDDAVATDGHDGAQGGANMDADDDVDAVANDMDADPDAPSTSQPFTSQVGPGQMLPAMSSTAL